MTTLDAHPHARYGRGMDYRDELTALTRAVLDVAEQQRIANLVALSALGGESAKAPARALIRVGEDGNFDAYWPNVADTLGMECS